jgi:polyphosphate kinase 2 (PPK2 family)
VCIPRFSVARISRKSFSLLDLADRYRSIVNLEERLHRNGTCILKFFLHLSKEKKRKRFLKRIDEPEKNWKFSLADVEERQYWKQYMKGTKPPPALLMRPGMLYPGR